MKKTMENQQTPIARNEELVVKELPEEVLVYDLRQHKAHCLNQTAAFIWHHCDGYTTVDEIAKRMEKEWRTPVSEDAVWFALNKLSKADLLEERIALPAAKAALSRRSAVRRLGMGSLLAIPVVMSIVSPTAMAQASIPAVCLSCVKSIKTAADCGACANISGKCYDNAGCGAGQLLNPCTTCATCGNSKGSQQTKSFQAPC